MTYLENDGQRERYITKTTSLMEDLKANEAGILSERQLEAFHQKSLSVGRGSKELVVAGSALLILFGLPILSAYSNPSINRIDENFILIAVFLMLVPLLGMVGRNTVRQYARVFETGGQVKVIDGRIKFKTDEGVTSIRVNRHTFRMDFHSEWQARKEEIYRLYYEPITRQLLSAEWKGVADD